MRELQEWEICRIEGARLIPLGDLPYRLQELDSTTPIVTYCKVGVRSGQAARLLHAAGFSTAQNLLGGIDAWATEVDQTLPTY